MKTLALITVTIFCSQVIFSQKYITNNIIVDSETRQPIDNVNLFNSLNNTITNKEGFLTFSSSINTVTISHLGYEEVVTNFTNLNKTDTIFLKRNTITLNEVLVSDKKQLINKVYENVALNYLFEPFTEEAFIRCILRKNGAIIKFQDMVVNIHRNSLFTNNNIKQLDCDFQILNIRKAGIAPKSRKEPDFKLLSINELLNWYSGIFTTPLYYNYHENSVLDKKHLKIDFNKKENLTEQKSLVGYYVINLEDFSFNEVNYKTVFADVSKIPYNENKGVKWRTIGEELLIQYKKDNIQKKYLINNGVFKNTVEVFNKDKRSIYEATYQLVSLENNKNVKVRSNFSSTKDLFKAETDFNSSFWEKQSQLVLDSELKDFIKNLDGYKKEYEIYSNFK